LASGFTVTYAHHFLINGKRGKALYGLLYTIILATIFTALQGVEYSVSSFTISDGAFGSCFYFGTGLILAPILKSICMKIKISNYSTVKAQDKRSNPINSTSNLNPNWIIGFCNAFTKGVKHFSTKRSCSNNQLSLVVWGINLNSSLGNGRITNQENSMIKLPPYQKSIIIGLILSDGWLSFPAKRSNYPRLGFKQSLSHSTYVWFVFNILSPYCNTGPKLVSNVKVDKIHYALGLFTRSLTCFIELHSLFYLKGVKVIPQNIYDLLTPVALAHLIMGDGNALHHGLIICTNSYSIQDVVKLMNVLMIRYGLECTMTLKKQNQKVEYMIYIRQNSMSLLRSIVKPYLCSSMLYKLDNSKVYPTTKCSVIKEFRQKRLYSTINTQKEINPYWVTGFADAKSSFSVRIAKDEKRFKSLRIAPIFTIELHEKDFDLLKQINAFFTVGTIIKRVKNGNPSVIYWVQSTKALKDVIIPHFNKYNLLTQKREDFRMFSLVVDILYNGQHKTEEGLNKILSYKASISKGLSKSLLDMFPDIIPVARNLILSTKDFNPFWVAGFVDGEGCFYVKTSKTHSGYRVSPYFYIAQHIRDIDLLENLVIYLNCGLVETVKTRPTQSSYVVYKFNDITNKIIPFFEKYSLRGNKLLDFYDFKKVVNIVGEINKYDEHSATLKEILKIKRNMNRNR